MAIVALVVRVETVITLAIRHRNVTPNATPVGSATIITILWALLRHGKTCKFCVTDDLIWRPVMPR